jgi:predicted nucleotidyltransferase
MFCLEERDRVRQRLLHLAEADPTVVGAAITGSHATDDGDRWSDIDLAFAIQGPLGGLAGVPAVRVPGSRHRVHPGSRDRPAWPELA